MDSLLRLLTRRKSWAVPLILDCLILSVPIYFQYLVLQSQGKGHFWLLAHFHPSSLHIPDGSSCHERLWCPTVEGCGRAWRAATAEEVKGGSWTPGRQAKLGRRNSTSPCPHHTAQPTGSSLAAYCKGVQDLSTN